MRDNLVDNVLQLAAGVANTSSGLCNQIKTGIKDKIDNFVYEHNLVTREEFEEQQRLLLELSKQQQEIIKKLNKLTKTKKK